MERKELGLGAWWVFDREFLDAWEADQLWRALDGCSFETRTIQALGKQVEQPRLMGWYGGLDYRYSGQTLPARPIPTWLAPIWKQVESRLGVVFNHCVVNHYRDGNDHVAMHADNEPELGRNPLIASLSIGETRLFEMAAKNRKRRQRVKLSHRSLLLMGGTSQLAWRHRVPASSTCLPRYNLTFRRLLGPVGSVANEQPYLRRVTRFESKEWSKLAQRCFRQTFEHNNDPARLADYLAVDLAQEPLFKELVDPNIRVWFLWHPATGSPIGFLQLKNRAPLAGCDGQRPLCLSRIYLLSRFRGAGYGDLLMKHAFSIAREEGFDGIWLGVWEHNDPAIRFYQRWGFRRVGEMVFDLGGEHQTDALMSVVI